MKKTLTRIPIKTTKNLILPVAFGLPFFLGFESGGFQLALLMISDTYNLSTETMGILVSLQYGGSILGPIVFGDFINRVSKKYSSLLAMTLFVFGCFLLLLSPELYAFFVGVFIMGMGFSLSQTCSSSALSDAFPGQSSRYINLAQVFFSSGAVISPMVTSWAITSLGFTWKFIFIVSACGYLLLIIPLMFTHFPTAEKLPEHKPMGYRVLIRSTRIGYLVIAIFIYVGVESGLAFFMALLFSDIFQTDYLTAFAISGIWIAMIPARIATGILYRFRRKLVPALFLINAVLFTALSFSPNPWFALVCCLLLGFSLGPIWPTLIGLGTEESPENSGATTGLLNVASGIGGAVFPILMSFSAAWFGIRISYILLALYCLAALTVLKKYQLYKQV